MEPVAIITPEVGCESFEVGGVRYTKTETLTLGRAILFQRFQTELQFNMYISDVQKSIVQAIHDFNGLKLVDGCARLKRLADATDIIGMNRLREADVCALFYNKEGENPASEDYDQVVKAKVAAWRAGGVGASFFTKTAWFLVVNFLKHCQPLPEEVEASEPMSPLNES